MRGVLKALLLALFLTGCPPVVDPVDPSPPPPPPDPDAHYLDGAWSGDVESALQFTLPLTLRLAVDDGAISGTAYLPAEPVDTAGVAIGNVTADVASLDIVIMGNGDTLRFTLVGAVDDDTFAGDVHNLLGAGGTFHLERAP